MIKTVDGGTFQYCRCYQAEAGKYYAVKFLISPGFANELITNIYEPTNFC